MSRDFRAAGAALEERLASIPRKPVEPRGERQCKHDGACTANRCVFAAVAPRAGSGTAALDVAAVVPPTGAYICHRCTAQIPLPGVCAACGEADIIDGAIAEMYSAIASIPVAYEETSKPSTLPIVCQLQLRADPWARAESIAMELATGAARTVLIWGGESGTGKSSLACAILRAVNVIAFEALIAWRHEVPASRLGPMPAEPRVIQLGRGARVVHDLALLSDLALGPEAPPGAYALASAAPLLVLDGVSGADGRGIKATTRLLEERWLGARPTVVTTLLSPDEIGRVYDGSIRRRLCDDRAARVIRVL